MYGVVARTLRASHTLNGMTARPRTKLRRDSDVMAVASLGKSRHPAVRGKGRMLPVAPECIEQRDACHRTVKIFRYAYMSKCENRTAGCSSIPRIAYTRIFHPAD